MSGIALTSEKVDQVLGQRPERLPLRRWMMYHALR